MVQNLSLEPLASISMELGHGVPRAQGAQQTPPFEARWLKAAPAGCGLVNLGNTCFMNSVLQCLAHLPPLANLCLAQAHARVCTNRQGSSCMCCLVEAQIRRILLGSSNAADAPHPLHRSLSQLNRGFLPGAQEDAHELLRCLTDTMERCLLRQQAGGLHPQRPPRCPKTWLNGLFQGILQSQVVCLVCGHVSSTCDPFMDLSLELDPGCSSVDDCFRHFTTVERLDGDNKYRCDGCKQLVPARKQMTIWDDPNILVIHLKRFDAFGGGKIMRPIRYPQNLCIEPYMCRSRQLRSGQQQHSNGGGWGGGSSSSFANNNNNSNNNSSSRYSSLIGSVAVLNKCGSSSNGSSISNGNSNGSNGSSGHYRSQQQRGPPRTTPGDYVLHGVLVHSGKDSKWGHYYAYVKDGQPPDGYWHCKNDSQVYRVDKNSALQPAAAQAYMLFYVRRTMKPQADLPVQAEGETAVAAGVTTAAAAAAGPGRLKRSSSSSGEEQQGSDQQRVFGPQLPPHLLSKRQRVSAPQQQQQPRVLGPSLPPAMQQQQRERVIGPALPPALQQQQQQQQQSVDMFEPQQESIQPTEVAFGPALPPGWAPTNSSGGGSNAAHTRSSDTAATAAAAGACGLAGAAAAAMSAAAGPATTRNKANGSSSMLAAQQQQQQPVAPSPWNQHTAVDSSSMQQVPREADSIPALAAAAMAAMGNSISGGGSSGSSGDGCTAAPSPSEAAFRATVERKLYDRMGEVRPWLKSELQQAKQQGLSLQECKPGLLGVLRGHTAIRDAARQLLQQMMDSWVPAVGSSRSREGG